MARSQREGDKVSNHSEVTNPEDSDIKLKTLKLRRALYGSASYLATVLSSQMFGVVKSVVTPIVFAPSQLGLWNFSNVILSYGANSHLGVLHGMNRLYPIAAARGDADEASKIQGNAFVLNLMFTALVSLALLGTFPLVQPDLQWPVCIIALVNLAQGLFSYYTCILRSTKAFGAVGMALVVFSVASTLTLCLSRYLPNRLYFALIGLGLSYAIAAAFQRRRAPSVSSWSLDRPTVISLFTVGLPMAGTVMIDTLFLSVDRWVLLTKVTAADLGYYALPLTCSSFLSTIPTTISNILFPRFLERFARAESAASTTGLFDMSYLFVSYLHLLIVFCCTALLPVIIHLFLTKYLPAASYFEWLLPAAFLYSLAALSSSFLVAINKFKFLAAVDALLLLTNLLLALRLVDYGVRGIIWSTSISYALFGAAYLVIAQYFSSRSWRALLILIARIGMPFVSSLVAIYAIRTSTFIFQDGRSPLLALANALMMIAAGGVFILLSMTISSWNLIKSHSLIQIIKTLRAP